MHGVGDGPGAVYVKIKSLAHGQTTMQRSTLLRAGVFSVRDGLDTHTLGLMVWFTRFAVKTM
jgi:hypothetical protein